MTLRITLDIFSGRPNPIIQLDGRQARDFLERVTPTTQLKRGEMPEPVGRLGYRGLIVEQTRAPIKSLPHMFRVAAGVLYGPDSAQNITDPGLEEFFVGLKGPGGKLTSE